MCIYTRTIYTNSKYIGRNSLHAMEVTAPCGHCVECTNRKKMDWSIRSYYEALRCLQLGGNILFDTLTYSEPYLPFAVDHVNGKNYYLHTCFNRESVKRFFKRLRRRLEYEGYNVSENLRYFLTSEYGVDDRFTHRPHYHVLFYNNTGCDPLHLSRLISECWRFGRTDGVKYKGRNYVLQNRVFRGVDGHAIGVFQYVAKYVCKDSYYSDLVVNDLKRYFDWKYIHCEWRNNPEIMKEYVSVYRHMSQFHVESKNFGQYALQLFTPDELLENNNIRFQSPGQNTPYQYPPLPKYYLRKLLYETYKFRGKRYEKLNALGMRWKRHLFDLQVRNLEKKVFGAVQYWITQNVGVSVRLETILKKYTCYDIAFYQLGVRGRLIPELPIEWRDIPDESFKFQHPQEIIDGGNMLYGYCHYIDKQYFKKRFISNSYLGEAPYIGVGTKLIPVEHISTSQIEDMTFQNYDLNFVLDLVQTWLQIFGAKKQEEYERKKYLKYHYEKNGILTRSI